MSLWQYNAWCEAYQARTIDTLSLQLQAAYYGAYWNGASKHKKSLKSVLKALRSKEKQEPVVEPIVLEQAEAIFKKYEEMIANARKKVDGD